MKLEIRHLFHSHLRKIADLNSLENPSDMKPACDVGYCSSRDLDSFLRHGMT